MSTTSTISTTPELFTRHLQVTAEQVQNLQVWKQIVAKAWSNAEFRQQLLANPNETLAANGYVVPAGVTINIVADTQTQRNLVLPSHGSDVSVVPSEGQDWPPPAF